VVKGALDWPPLLARYAEHLDLLFEIADLFAVQAPLWIEAMDQAVLRSDSDALASAAHALRGSAGNFMAAETVEAAHWLEETAGKGDLILAGSGVPRLKKSVLHLLHELAQIRHRAGVRLPRLPGGPLV
jgi:HPt (histidine-containing phosphotransfer) domain-containing protein